MKLLSADSVGCQDNSDEVINFPVEYLNTITLSGLPSHILQLKVGCPVVLLRNLNPAKVYAMVPD